MRQTAKVIALFIFCLSLVSCSSKENISEYKFRSGIMLEGVVSSLPHEKDSFIIFTFSTPKYGKFLLRADNNLSHYIIPANKLELEVKLNKDYKTANVNAFDYADYLDTKSIVARGTVVQDKSITFNGVSPLYMLERLRYELKQHIERNLGNSDVKNLVLALLVGDKHFSEKYQKLFMHTGTSHLMVISGLHVGLLALFSFVVMRIVWSMFPFLCRHVPAQKPAIISSLAIVFIYCFLSGFAPPALRATLMIFVLGMFWLIGRKVSVLRTLIVCFLLILFFDFKVVYSVSLWLSFSAVTLLIFIGVLLQQYSNKYKNSILSQIYLSIFLIPITIYSFGVFSSVGIVANLVAIPLVSFIVVPLLLLSLVLSFVGVKLWFLATFVLHGLLLFLSFLETKFSFIEYHDYLSFGALIVILFGLALVFLPVSKQFRLLGLACFFVIFQTTQNTSQQYRDFRINIFDTHKQLIVIQDNGKTILYSDSESLDNAYLLMNTLEPFLQKSGIKQLDYVIVATGEPNLSILESIISVNKMIMVFMDDKSKKCELENSFNFDRKYLLFASKNSCYLNIQGKINSIFFLPKDNKSERQRVFSIYHRILKANVLITASESTNSFLSYLKPKYLIYQEPQKMNSSELRSLEEMRIKVFETSSNGAISLIIDAKQQMQLKSLLKNY